MQKPSDEELVNIVMKLGLDGCRDFTSDELKTDLLFRLERGKKAIEAMEKVENWLRNDSLYFSKLQNIINDYQR